MPLIWDKLLEMTTKDRQRTGITKDMDDSASRHKKEIDTDDIRADDATMKDVMALNSILMGCCPEFKDFAWGVTPLGSCPWMPYGSSTKIKRERTKDETGENMTFVENLSWKAGDPPTTPVYFAELLLMINTHCPALVTMFCEACTIYVDL